MDFHTLKLPAMSPRQPLSLNTIRAGMQCMAPDMLRDDWARVAMALKSHLPEAEGFALFDQWSQGSERYRAADAKATWRSVKATGGVGIGTLMTMAKDAGFDLAAHLSAERLGQAVPIAAPPPEVTEAQRAAEAERARTERAAGELAHERAAKRAQELCQVGRTTGSNAYLDRHGLQAVPGVLFGDNDELLVPLRDAAGKVWNVQRILPNKPASGPDKLLLKGSRKAGLWHWLGEPQGAPVLLIAEGLATAASVQLATQRPTAFAVDAGNLAAVGKALRAAHPDALIVFAADNDAETEARTGQNPGVAKATAAARAVRGTVAYPTGLAEGLTDWNDAHRTGGLDAVREPIERAISAALSDVGAKPPQGSKPPPASGGESEQAQDRFFVASGAVWSKEYNAQQRREYEVRVCDQVDVAARVRFQTGGGWGYLIAFADPEGRRKELAVNWQAFQGDGAEYRRALADMGLWIETSRLARERFIEYVRTRPVEGFARSVERSGWHGRVYVMPSQVIGETDERMVLQMEGAHEHPFTQRGELAQWRNSIARVSVGNTRLAFSVAAAFAGALVRLAELQSGGFHVCGQSSRGKSSVLLAAASVWGSPQMKRQWRSTDNAVEFLAQLHSDSLLILDELAQCDPKIVGEAVYCIGNGVGRNRGAMKGGLRPTPAWRTLLLSSGESTLEQHMAKAGKQTMEGQRVRLPSIPAEPEGCVATVFETNHEFAGGAELSKYIEQSAARWHGHAGIAFLRWVAPRFDDVRQQLRERMDDFVQEVASGSVDGQVARLADRFALVAVAGEIATEAGVTGWPQGEAWRASVACFKSMLAVRPGGTGSGEREAMLSQVKRWLQSSLGRLITWNRAVDPRAPDKGMPVGFKKLISRHGKAIESDRDYEAAYGQHLKGDVVSEDDATGTVTEYFLFKEAFKAEACAGLDERAVLALLLSLGYLKVSKGRTTDFKAKLPGIGPTWCYKLTSAVLGGGAESEGD